MPNRPPLSRVGNKAPRAAWHHDRPSRHQRGYGSAWERIRKEVLKRDRGLCQPCLADGGRVSVADAVDHIVPKAKGGGDDLGNLQGICRRCHLDKTLRDNGKRKRRVTIGLSGWPVED